METITSEDAQTGHAWLLIPNELSTERITGEQFFRRLFEQNVEEPLFWGDRYTGVTQHELVVPAEGDAPLIVMRAQRQSFPQTAKDMFDFPEDTEVIQRDSYQLLLPPTRTGKFQKVVEVTRDTRNSPIHGEYLEREDVHSWAPLSHERHVGFIKGHKRAIRPLLDQVLELL